MAEDHEKQKQRYIDGVVGAICTALFMTAPPREEWEPVKSPAGNGEKMPIRDEETLGCLLTAILVVAEAMKLQPDDITAMILRKRDDFMPAQMINLYNTAVVRCAQLHGTVISLDQAIEHETARLRHKPGKEN